MKHFDDKRIGDMTFSEFYQLWKLSVEIEEKTKKNNELFSQSFNHYTKIGFDYDKALAYAKLDADGIHDPAERMKLLKEKK